MHQILTFIRHIPETVAEWSKDYGIWVYGILFLIVFCETGLVVCPWLPGDSLLFAAGTLTLSTKAKEMGVEGGGLSIWVLMIILPIAAILGDNLNYYIGRKLGPKVFKKEGSLFFNKKTLDKTNAFYAKHGVKTVLLARFIPLVRTFAPFVAGVGRMEYIKFLTYGVAGAFIWVIVCCGAGHLFANNPVVKDNFEYVILGIIFVSIAPMMISFIKGKLRDQKAAKANSARTGTPPDGS